MPEIRNLEDSRFSNVVLTIGNFDGVHRGHQAILAAGRRRADAAGSNLVAMTFDPHPSTILTPDRVPSLLTPLHEKLRCLVQAGADTIVVAHVTPKFLKLSAEEFINKIIVEKCKPQWMVEGASFGFGHHRQGDVNTLRTAGEKHGFGVEVVEPVRAALGGHPDAVISSSLVRHLLVSGTVDGAAQCLGRPYALFGQVKHGAGRGKGLGFPTVNLTVDNQLIPAEGVYAGRAFLLAQSPSTVSIDDSPPSQAIAAAISIGRNPTFNESELSVEAFLLDFERDVYEHAIRLEFHEWLRPQQKFASPTALVEQIERDVTQTREIFITHQRK